MVKLSIENARVATEETYAGKALEVTGVVALFSQTGKLANISLRTSGFGSIPFTMDKEEVEPWAKVGKGQTVTLVGKFAGPKGFGVTLWKLKPTVGPPIFTGEALAEQFSKDPRQAERNLKDQGIIVTGTVKSVTFNEVDAGAVIIEGNKDYTVRCTAFPDQKAKLEMYKPGSKIQVTGACLLDITDPKQILMPLVDIITVALPVPGVEYAKEIESYESRQKQAAAAARSAKPEFTVSAVDLCGEFKKDDNAARKKYEGTVIEVSGTVRGLSEPYDGRRDEVKLMGGPEELGNDVVCGMSEGNPWNTMAPGQSVVIRGKLTNGIFGPELQDAIVMKVNDAGKPPEVTVDQLADELLKDPKAFEEKYANKWIVLQGTLEEYSSFASHLKPAKEVKFSVSLSAGDMGRHHTQFKTHKPGEAVRIVGKVSSIDAEGKRISLADCWERKQVR